MLDLTRLKLRLDSNLEAIARDEKRVQAKIIRVKEEEIRRSTKKAQELIEAQKEQYDSSIQDSVQGYLRNASSQMLLALQEDFRTLEVASDTTIISQEDLKKAEQTIRYRQIAENIEDPKIREVMLGAIYLGIDPKTQRAIDFLARKIPGRYEVTSYIAAGKEGLSVVVPANQESPKPLIKALENQVTELVARNSLDLRNKEDRTVDHKSTEVVGDNSGLIEFMNTDYRSAHGFLVYRIKTADRVSLQRLEKGLAEKISQNTPAELKEAKVTHSVQIIDPEVIDYFANHSIEDFNSPLDVLKRMQEQGKVSLTYDEASKISGKLKRILKTVKYRGRLEETKDGKLCIDSFINYLEGKSPFVPRAERVLSTDAQALRQETQRRLEEVSGQREVLTGRDLHYIFGINLASGPSIMAKKPWMQEYAFKNERGLLCFKKEGVRKMFDYGRITSGAWEFPKAGAD